MKHKKKNKLLQFLGLSFRVKRMLAQTFFLAGYYRYLILHKPFVEYAGKLGEKLPELRPRDCSYTKEQLAIADDVSWAVHAACKRTPWKSECMVQALCARHFLSKYGIHANIFMGVRVEPDGSMTAHAWTRCSKRSVTGGDGERFYTITGIFYA